MPKPYILRRRSGLYVRFLVPIDLRQTMGSTYVVRPLLAVKDDARLIAARMAVTLSRAFDSVRLGTMASDELKALKSGLRALQTGKSKDWQTDEIVLANGTRLKGVKVESDEDAQRFSKFLSDIGASAVAQSEPKKSSLTLARAIADHIADLQREKLDGRTILDSQHTLKLFAGIINDEKKLVAGIDQNDIRAFLDGVRWWPSNASKKSQYKGLSVLEIIALAQENGEKEPAPRTVQKHAQRLSVLFNALVASKDMDVNPVQGIRGIPRADDDDDGGREFSPGELAIIFEPNRFKTWAKKWPHRWFGTILGLYSGARVNEVAQLRTDDIECVEGVWGFTIRRKKDLDKKRKTPTSARFVPIAKPVLTAGFLKYVDEVRKSGHTRLFPNLPNSTGLGFGRQLSRQFSAYLKKECGIEEAGVGFHAFRHTIASELERSDVSIPTIASITGHAFKGQAPTLTGVYVNKTIPDRVAGLEKFRPLVELEPYKKDMFHRALKTAPIELVVVKK